MKRVIAALARVAMVCVASWAYPSAADELGDFYKGKIVKLVLGYPPTSGHNPYAQLLARSMGPHIPGRPVVVSQNMPGAGSMTAANWLYNVAPNDGTAIGIFAINVAIDALFGNSAAKFEPNKFNWVGNMAQNIAVCAVSPAAGVRTFAELQRKEVLFGASGPAGVTMQAALALRNLFGAKIKLVRGYGAGEEIALAMDRDEVQGRCGIPLSVLKTNLADRVRLGQIIPVIHDSPNKVLDLPRVPSVYDFAKSEDERQVLDLVFGWHVLGRAVAAPPNLAPDRLKSLQDAFMDTMNDAQFRADVHKSNLEIEPLSGPEVAILVRRFLSHPASSVDRAALVVRDN
jgi:tripartite-type tricarboxylate transporter receptor subunit TctC